MNWVHVGLQSQTDYTAGVYVGLQSQTDYAAGVYVGLQSQTDHAAGVYVGLQSQTDHADGGMGQLREVVSGMGKEMEWAKKWNEKKLIWSLYSPLTPQLDDVSLGRPLQLHSTY